jgi:hypothetical protein
VLVVIDWEKPLTLNHRDSFVWEGGDGVRLLSLAKVAGVRMLVSKCAASIPPQHAAHKDAGSSRPHTRAHPKDV